MNVLFTSDTHIGHKLAKRLRGFDSQQDHDWHIIETLISQCNKRSVLYILGDVCFEMEKMPLFHLIPGRKIMIHGNHDRFQTPVYLKYFEEVRGFMKYKEFWLSHCPIHPQELFGRCNLHGHLHKNARTGNLPFPDYFNLNWDWWGRALTLHEIRDMIANGDVPYNYD